MTAPFPFPIDFTLTKDEIDQDAGDDIRRIDATISGAQDAFDWVTFEAAARAESVTIDLAKIGNWPEFKTVMKVKCKWGICTKVPVAYRRSCTKFAYVKVGYPSEQDALNDIKQCIAGSALAAAVAAVIASGAAGAAVFEAALISCLKAKGYSWAEDVRVSAGWRSECGSWTPY